ncbi:MAG: hypothetical protein EAZ55_00230 [Cytophagales bacterium]|nr:MAG: hypothetical protein EAZ55_00230 [Cytophagales bacterium]
MKKYLSIAIISIFFYSYSNAQDWEKELKNMKSISPLEDKMSVKVGEKFYYSYSSHGSVGLYADYELADNIYVKFVQDYLKYENPQYKSNNTVMTGADAATGYFIFEALAEGSIEITFREMFRGSAQREHKVKVQVVK